jgi:hypothetical protein
MRAARLPLLVLVVSSLGCVSVRPLRDPATFIAEAKPPLVYVTHNNGAQLTIVHPRVSGDSLLGIWQDVAQPLALPLNHLQRIEASQRDKTRTRLLITGVSVVTGALAFLLTRTTSETGRPCNFEGGQQFQGCDVHRPPDGDGRRGT